MTSKEIRWKIHEKEKRLSELTLLDLPRMAAMVKKELIRLREDLIEAEYLESKEKAPTD